MKLNLLLLLGLLCISGTLGRSTKSIFDSQQLGLFLQQEAEQESEDSSEEEASVDAEEEQQEEEQQEDQSVVSLDIATEQKTISNATPDSIDVSQTTATFEKQEFGDYIEQIQQNAQEYGAYLVLTIEYEDGTIETITEQDLNQFIDTLNQIYDEMEDDQSVTIVMEGSNLQYTILDQDDLHEQSASYTQEETGSDKDTDHSVDEDATIIEDFNWDNSVTETEIQDNEDTSNSASSQESHDEYVERITEDPDYEEDIEVVPTGTTDQDMVGDTTSNSNSDLTTLTLVAPSQQAQNIEYDDLEDYTEDDADYQQETTESQNPDIHTFLQMQSNPDNPLDRDEDDLPESADDPGQEAIDGDTYWILVSSFTSTAGTGKVWQIPVDEEQQYKSQLFLAGFQEPTGICFDKNTDFLYVVDNGGDTNGHIYQYEVDWDEDDYFILARELYVDVYEGPGPYDCKIDAYGNLFFVDAEIDQVLMIGYLDLWAGFKNRHYTLYYNDGETPVSHPVALDVINSEDIYFVNNENTQDLGLVIQAEAFTEYVNGQKMEELKRSQQPGWGVAFSTEEEAVYYSVDNGNVYRIQLEDPSDDVLKTTDFFDEPRGICYGSETIYVADHGFGGIFSFEDNDEQNIDPEPVVMIQGSYAVYCINEG